LRNDTLLTKALALSGYDRRLSSNIGYSHQDHQIMRPVLSCDPCRRRKTRCSRGQPCTSCAARSDNCIWSRGNPLASNDASQKSTQELQSDIAVLERLVSALQTRLIAQGPLPSLTTTSRTPSLHSSCSGTSSPGEAPSPVANQDAVLPPTLSPPPGDYFSNPSSGLELFVNDPSLLINNQPIFEPSYALSPLDALPFPDSNFQNFDKSRDARVEQIAAWWMA